MKKLIIVLIAFCSFTTIAQEAIGLQATQNLNNSPFAPDLQFKAVMQGNDSPTGYLIISAKYQYAKLHDGDYSRFGAEIGYAFHTSILKIDIAPVAGYGFAYRWDGIYPNFEFGAEIKLPLTDFISAIALVNATQRRDLNQCKISPSIGLRFDIR